MIKIKDLSYVEFWINPENGRLISHYLMEEVGALINEENYLRNHFQNEFYYKEIISQLIGIGGNEVKFSIPEYSYSGCQNIKRKNVTIKSSILFPQIRMPWESFNFAILFRSDWGYPYGLELDLFEVIFTPYKTWHPIDRIPEDKSKEALETVEYYLEEIKPIIKALIKTFDKRKQLDIHFEKPKWEEHCCPSTGGDGFRIRAMLITPQKPLIVGRTYSR